MIPEIKSIMSRDLEYGALPEEPDDCEVLIEVEIGPKGETGVDVFYLTAITPKAIMRKADTRWGRGYLITPTFSWSDVEKTLRSLLLRCIGDDWTEISDKLNRVLNREHENNLPI
jgi:hypothetical protein